MVVIPQKHDIPGTFGGCSDKNWLQMPDVCVWESSNQPELAGFLPFYQDTNGQKLVCVESTLIGCYD